MGPRWIRGISAAFIFLAVFAGLVFFPGYLDSISRFLRLPPVQTVPSPDPKSTVEWAQEILRTGHQLVSYLWILGAIVIGFVAAIAYYFFTWSAEHREILRALASWQTTVARAERAALDAARRLPAQVFLNFKNPEVRRRYEEELLRIRPEGSPEEIDLHIQTVALLTDVPAEIYVRLGNYFRFRAYSQRDDFKTRDFWFAIRRYQIARERALAAGGSVAGRTFGHASHGIAICFFNMGLIRDALPYAAEAVDALRLDFVAAPPALITHGTALLTLGRLDESLRVLTDATDRAPFDVVGIYNLACNYALLGAGEADPARRDRHYRTAIETLRRVTGRIGSDMGTIDKWEADADLKSLREDPGYGPILAQAIAEIRRAG